MKGYKDYVWRRSQFSDDTCRRAQIVLLRSGPVKYIRGDVRWGSISGQQDVRKLRQDDVQNDAIDIDVGGSGQDDTRSKHESRRIVTKFFSSKSRGRARSCSRRRLRPYDASMTRQWDWEAFAEQLDREGADTWTKRWWWKAELNFEQILLSRQRSRERDGSETYSDIGPSKDRQVSTSDEDMNDNVNEFESSALEKIRSFRVITKLTMKDQRRIVRMSKYLEGIQVRDIGLHPHSARGLRLDRLQIQKEQHVRWSCIIHHRGRQALEFHAEIADVVVVRSKYVRQTRRQRRSWKSGVGSQKLESRTTSCS